MIDSWHWVLGVALGITLVLVSGYAGYRLARKDRPAPPERPLDEVIASAPWPGVLLDDCKRVVRPNQRLQTLGWLCSEPGAPLEIKDEAGLELAQSQLRLTGLEDLLATARQPERQSLLGVRRDGRYQLLLLVDQLVEAPRGWHLLYLQLLPVDCRLHADQELLAACGTPAWLLDDTACSLFANAAACALTGHTPAELRTRPLFSLARPSAEAEQDWELVSQSPSPQRLCWQLQHEQGHELGVEINVQHLPDGRLLALGRDVSTWLERERKLRDSRDEAEGQSREKSRFLATMSHEIRTPLNAILGMAQLSAMGQSTEWELRRQASAIRRAGESLLQMLEQVLDVSRIESGRVEIRQQSLDLNALFEEVVSLYQRQAAQRGNRLVLHKRLEQLAQVRSDGVKIRQILVNLLSNAIKFTHQGTIDIHLDEEEKPQGWWLRLEVADTGAGIDLDEQQWIAESFYRGSQDSGAQVAGSGLGLFIVRRLCERLGGHLEFDSEPGQGSRFRCLLPLIPNTLAAVQHEPESTSLELPAPGTLPPLRVLVAEDMVESRYILETFLEQSGHQPHSVHNGQQVLDLEARDKLHGHYDLILMDCHMPVLDGLEATRQLRQREVARGRRFIPIIAITADAYSEDRERCIRAGMNAFVSKPLRLSKLLETMASVVQGESRLLLS